MKNLEKIYKYWEQVYSAPDIKTREKVISQIEKKYQHTEKGGSV